MAFNGTRLFRYALLMEAAANVGGAIPMLLSPDTFLKLVVTGPNMINPATRSFTQWCVTSSLCALYRQLTGPSSPGLLA